MYMRNQKYISTTFYLSAECRWMVNITPRPLYTGTEPRCLLNSRFGGTQTWFGRFGEKMKNDEKDEFSSAGIRNPGCPARGLVTVLIRLS